ncbi:MAG: hypothetical protein SFU20_05780 [Chitinophagaceae bacterium]|nr:hypothetical protein [Chitinophagaceae bacterium]
MRKNKVMKTLFFIFNCIGCFSCSQKEMIFKISNLEPQELRVYYNWEGFPKLPQDSMGNYVVVFDTSKIIFTSTSFTEIKNHTNTFCFKDYNYKCFKEDMEIEQLGFTINTYSHFSSDTTKREKYKNPYDQILIEKVNREAMRKNN